MNRLVGFARRIEVTDRASAAGCCLGLSLALAAAAREKYRVEVELLRWRVIDDPHYMDHWAVGIGPDTVLDLTRVQVDGTPRLLGSHSDYPANFVAMRRYPASLLLVGYDTQETRRDGRLSGRFMRSIGLSVWRHDVIAACRGRNIQLAFSATRHLASFMGWLALRETTQALERHAMHLLSRLEDAPSYADRRTARAEPDHPSEPLVTGQRRADREFVGAVNQRR